MTLHHCVRSLLATLLLFGTPAAASATVYHGLPHLHLTAAVFDAGGGRDHFSAHRLVRTLAGAGYTAENAKLNRQYGVARVNDFYRVFTFAIDDASKRANSFLIPLPKGAKPDPHDGRALSLALYGAGLTPARRFDVGYMLEVLMSHQIHHNIMGDMDKTFTPPVNGDFHVTLTTLMHDLHREYAS